jgi:hypothetical protein
MISRLTPITCRKRPPRRSAQFCRERPPRRSVHVLVQYCNLILAGKPDIVRLDNIINKE